jgi:hypothetical protein
MCKLKSLFFQESNARGGQTTTKLKVLAVFLLFVDADNFCSRIWNKLPEIA